MSETLYCVTVYNPEDFERLFSALKNTGDFEALWDFGDGDFTLETPEQSEIAKDLGFLVEECESEG